MLGDAKSRGPATIAPRWRRDKQLFSEGVRLFRRPAKARRLLFPGHWFFCGCGVFPRDVSRHTRIRVFTWYLHLFTLPLAAFWIRPSRSPELRRVTLLIWRL
jgi:hypothetical protein